MKRALYFLLAAIFLSAAVYFLRGGREDTSGPVPEMLAQLPADAPFILYADLAALRASPLVEQLAALAAPAQQDPEYASFVSQTGFDYTRDLDRVAVALRPGPPASGHGGSVQVIAEGRFDRKKIAAYALRTGRNETQDNREVYVVPGARPSDSISFSFLQPNRIAIADTPQLPPFAAGTPDAELQERVTRVAGSAVFIVGRASALPAGLASLGWQSDQLDTLVRSLRWYSLAARPVEDRVKIVLDADCDSPENARQLSGVLDGLRMLAQAALADPNMRRRMQPAPLALADSLLRSADISRSDATVRVIFELTDKEISRALAQPSSDTTPPRKK